MLGGLQGYEEIDRQPSAVIRRRRFTAAIDTKEGEPAVIRREAVLGATLVGNPDVALFTVH
jgi:hypothetical protein